MFSLKKLLGKEDKFFDLLEASAKEAQKSAHALTTFLATSWQESQGSDASGAPWAAVTARRILTQL